MVTRVAPGTAKKVFIVITHSKQTKDGKSQVVEQCEFVDRLRNRDHNTASVILDYRNEKILKNRDGTGTFTDFVWYLHKNYPQQMAELASEYKGTIRS